MIKELTLGFTLLATPVQKEQVLRKISLIAPHVSSSTSLKVAQGLQECKGLNENLVLSIIRVESNFKIKAYNPRSADYGLMQVNNWHVKRKALSKQKLLLDASYNMKHGCDILRYFVTRYSNMEEAIKRYNCGTKASCVEWDGPKKYLKKVLTFKKKLDKMDVQENIGRSK